MEAAAGIDAPAKTPFPDLDAERELLAHARRARDRMIDRLELVDPLSSADEFTAQYIEMTVWDALHDLQSPGAGDFFGRIDTVPDEVGSESTRARAEQRLDTWYIGRRHIEDDHHDPGDRLAGARGGAVLPGHRS